MSEDAERLLIQRNGNAWLMPSRTRIGIVEKQDILWAASCKDCGWGTVNYTRSLAAEQLVKHWKESW